MTGGSAQLTGDGLGGQFPDFFILGAPKCGTTSLFEWLRRHPGTYLPHKEPNFLSPDVFDARHLPGAFRTWDQYLARLCPPEARGKMTGEATPKYLYSDQALTELEKRKDRVRLIVLLRNPVDLVVSLHWQLVKQGDESELDFETAWRRSFAKTHGGPVPAPPGGRVDRRFDYPFWGLFAQRLDRLFQLFDRHQVKILMLEEEMTRDPRRAFADVLAFVDLPFVDLPNFPIENKATNYRSIWLRQKVVKARRAIFSKIVPPGLRPSCGIGLLRAFDRFNAKSGGRRLLFDASFRRDLADFFRKDVQLTAELLNRRSMPWDDFE